MTPGSRKTLSPANPPEEKRDAPLANLNFLSVQAS
jgi:hypothetical protein